METQVRTYRKLEAWQRGVDLILLAYKLADKLPASERYGLSAQIRRAATSVPANVAEGFERRGRGYLQHLRIALESVAELDTHLEVALRLQLVKPQDVGALKPEIARVGQLLHGLRRSVQRGLLAKTATAAAPVAIVFCLLWL